MDESLEADLIAAHSLRFDGDRAAWVDVYMTSASRRDVHAELEELAAAADRAWLSHAWVHPAVAAHLEQQFGALDDA